MGHLPGADAYQFASLDTRYEGAKTLQLNIDEHDDALFSSGWAAILKAISG
jgi:hypothetical protein